MTINIGKKQLIILVSLSIIAMCLSFLYAGYTKQRYEKTAEELKINTLILTGYCENILSDYSDNWSRAIEHNQVLDQNGNYSYCSDFSEAVSLRHQFYVNNGTFSLLDSISTEMNSEMKTMKHTPSKYEEVQNCFNEIYNKANELYELCKNPKGTLLEFNSSINDAVINVSTKIKETDLTIPNVDKEVSKRVSKIIGDAAKKALVDKMEAMKKDPTYIEGKSFLATNKSKPGVITTKSGLQYKIIKKGYGIRPTDISKVVIHYRGTTIDGEEFDSSYKRNQPATLTVGQNIKGFAEGLKLMQEGSEYIFYLPQDLGYGEQEAGAIKPYSTMIFDVKLLKVKNE